MPSVLIASVVNQDPDVLSAFLERIEAAASGAPASTDYCFILDPDCANEASELLPGTVLAGDSKPDEALYRKDEQTTRWNEPSFEWMAMQRQRLLDYAVEHSYDYIFMVDTDLLLGESTLRSLLSSDAPITSGVFWTQWRPGSEPMPQVWLRHPYGLEGMGLSQAEFLRALHTDELIEVKGLGACTLIDTDVIGPVRYHPRLEGLPQEGMWRGEDRSFCIRAERNHIPMKADPWPEIFHVYRPSDREKIPQVLDELEDRERQGGRVNFTIEPLDEPRLVGYKAHVRGLENGIEMFPEFREILADLEPGQEAIQQVDVPVWWEQIGGQERSYRIALIDRKPVEEMDNNE